MSAHNHESHAVYPVMLGLASAALFGAATPASKTLLTGLTAFQLAGLLYLGAACGVLPAVLRAGGILRVWSADLKTRGRLLGAIFFGGVLGPVFLLLGLKVASAASVSLWLNLELVATALLGRFLFRDHLGPFGWVGVAGVVVAGVLLSAGEGAAGIKAGVLVGLGCFCWGIDNHLTALIDGITPAQSTFWKGIVAGTVNLGIGLAAGSFDTGVSTVLLAGLVGVLAYGASIVMYITAAQNLGATRGQMLFATSPFFGVVLSWMVLREPVAAMQVAAVGILLLSLAAMFADRHAHAHEHVAMDHEHSHRHDDAHHDHEHAERVPPGTRHSHRHEHKSALHAHPHWPDLHHRHKHEK